MRPPRTYAHGYNKLWRDDFGGLMARSGAAENWKKYVAAEQRERTAGNLKLARQFASYRVEMENTLLQYDAAEGGNI